MPKSPITLRYKDADDLAHQLSLHRLNALAYSLHTSSLVQPLRPPQSVPYASPRTDAAGSDLAAQYTATLAELEENARQWREGKWDEWEKAERLDKRQTRLLERKARLQAELSALPYSKGSKPGIPGLYEVMVPPVLLHSASVGIGEGMRAGEMWRLDVRALTGEIREAVDAYLASGKSLTPCHYDPRIRRYCWRTACPQADRDLLTALLGQMQRQDIVLVRLKTPEAQP